MPKSIHASASPASPAARGPKDHTPITVLVVLILALALAACGRDRQEEPTPFPTSTPVAAAPAEAAATPEPTEAGAAVEASASEQVSETSAADQPESPLAPESPMPTPTSIAEALGLKTSASAGALTGVLLTSVTGAEQPIPLLQIGLAEIIRDENGEPKVGGYDPSSAPRTETDDTGRFSFSELKPGTYTIIADYVAAQIQLQEGGDGKTIMVEIQPGEVTNLGDLRFPKLPMPPN